MTEDESTRGTSIAQEVLDAQRLDKAVKMRVKGALWSEIAQVCGYPSPASALRDVGRAMAAATQRAEETADMMRNTFRMRYDAIVAEAWSLYDDTAPETYDADGNPLVSDDRAVKLRALDEIRRATEATIKLEGLKPPESETEKAAVIKVVGISVDQIV